MRRPAEPLGRPDRWRRALGPAVLFAVVVALYAPSQEYGFIYDDYVQIESQAAPTSLGDLGQTFVEPHPAMQQYYRPLVRLTLLGQKVLHGDSPGPYHLFNVVLIAVTALLVYALLRLPVLAVRQPLALLGAGLAAVHPIASSLVYPITGREALLASALTLLAVYGWLRGGRWGYHLALGGFAGALLCREQAVIVPGLFLLADGLGLLADRSRRSLGRWVGRYAPVVGVFTVYALLRALALQGPGSLRLAIVDEPEGPLLSVLYGLQTIMVPFAELTYEPDVDVWLSPWRLAVGVAVAGLLAFEGYRHWPAVRTRTLFWLGWLSLAAVPTANVVVQETPFAERHAFLVLVGVLGAAATLASIRWDQPVARRWLTGVGVVVVGACAAVSVQRGPYFLDNFTFLTQWVRTSPQGAQPHLTLGFAFAREERLDEAIHHFQQAFQLWPDPTPSPQSREARSRAAAHHIVGRAFGEQGNIDQAINHYRTALAYNPDAAAVYSDLGLALVTTGRVDEGIRRYRTALQLEPTLTEAHDRLGMVLVEQDRPEEAIEHFEQVLEMEPGHTDAHSKLGLALTLSGRIEEAIEHHQRSLDLNPGSADTHYNLGLAQLMPGRIEGAIQQYRQALDLNPAHVDAHYRLGMALGSQGRHADAAQHFRRAAQLEPELANAHYQLGVALGAQGELGEAIEHLRRALEVEPDYVDAHFNLALALTMSGQVDEAIRHYRDAVQLEPNFVAARYQLGIALGSQGELDEAIEHLRRVVEVEPRHADAHARLATALRMTGQPDEARVHEQEAARLPRERE